MRPWRKSFVQARTGLRAGHLQEIYAHCSSRERELSAAFYQRYAAGLDTAGLTPFAGIREGPGPLAGAPDIATRPGDAEELGQRLGCSLLESLEPSGEVAVALSGGIDSWLLATLLRSLGFAVHGWYLESRIPGYCECERVAWLSQQLDIACSYIPAGPGAFTGALPAFVAITETPLYNLHPVSKLLLARGLRERGITTVVTGDGADQVMRRQWHCDLLPLTLSCFQQEGVQVILPFVTAPVVAICDRADANKSLVRELASRLGVPEIPKHPTMFPPALLPEHPRAVLPGNHLQASDDRLSCLAYSTGLLLQAIGGHSLCAASPA